MTAKTGDYIIRGIKGEIYPCRADIFEQTYELVEGMSKCNHKRCPMQVGSVPDDCDIKECPYRTEDDKNEKNIQCPEQNGIDETTKQCCLYVAEQLVRSIKNAIEKQIPKKIIRIGVKSFCPICNADANSWHLYCHNCGQALDWSEIYEKEGNENERRT